MKPPVLLAATYAALLIALPAFADRGEPFLPLALLALLIAVGAALAAAIAAAAVESGFADPLPAPCGDGPTDARRERAQLAALEGARARLRAARGGPAVRMRRKILDFLVRDRRVRGRRSPPGSGGDRDG